MEIKTEVKMIQYFDDHWYRRIIPREKSEDEIMWYPSVTTKLGIVEKYGLDSMNRRMITGEALEFCYLFLKRPYMEGDRKFFGKITQEIKSTQEIKGSRGGGSVLNPFNWGKRNS